MSTTPTDWCFSYSLSQKITFSNLVSSTKIKFKTESGPKGNLLTGVDIFLFNEVKDRASITSERIAKRLVIIISLRVGVPLEIHLTGVAMKDPSGQGWTTSTSLPVRFNVFDNLNLDLTDGHISGIVHQDTAFSERLYHAYWGLRASQDQNYETMVTQFYQTIEKVLPRESEPYKALRDVLSHPEGPFERTKKSLEDSFPSEKFEYTLSGKFDFNSPTNFELIKSKAAGLRKLALDYIKQELR